MKAVLDVRYVTKLCRHYQTWGWTPKCAARKHMMVQGPCQVAIMDVPNFFRTCPQEPFISIVQAISYLHGKRICKEAFLFLHCISQTKFCSLAKHYKKNGLTLHSHRNKKRLPSSTFSAGSVDKVVKFILNVVEDQALLLPGRIPGFKRVDC